MGLARAGNRWEEPRSVDEEYGGDLKRSGPLTGPPSAQLLLFVVMVFVVVDYFLTFAFFLKCKLFTVTFLDTINPLIMAGAFIY